MRTGNFLPHQLVAGHLVSSIISANEKMTERVLPLVERAFFLDQPSFSKRTEKIFYTLCWEPIQSITRGPYSNRDVMRLAYMVLESFAEVLSAKSHDYLHYVQKLLFQLRSDLSINEGVKASMAEYRCFASYIRYNKINLKNVANGANEMCFLSVSRGTPELILGAMCVWRGLLVDSSAPYMSLNLPLVMARLQRLAMGKDEDIREEASLLLSDILEYSRSLDYYHPESVRESFSVTSSINNVDVSLDQFDLGNPEEIEYFLRGSIPVPAMPSTITQGENKTREDVLIHRLVKEVEALGDSDASFSNRDLFNIEKAITEGVQSRRDESFTYTECIFSKYLEIIYEDLTSRAKESIVVDPSLLDLAHVGQHIDHCSSLVLSKAEDLETKFLDHVVPILQQIIPV
jgi:hypothetical protein